MSNVVIKNLPIISNINKLDVVGLFLLLEEKLDEKGGDVKMGDFVVFFVFD